MSDPANARLIAALKERLALIGDRGFYQRDAAGHLAALATVSERIESLQNSLKPPIDPKLKHYLERRSYAKALATLEEHKAGATRGA